MTLVVADTTPLRYLVEIGCESLLPQLFQVVWIPGAVARELSGKGAPEIVCRWAQSLPVWVEVRELAYPAFAEELHGLDRGEWEAIQLAHDIDADLLLIDERTGARVARDHGFTVTGTIGVLVEAARAGLLPINESLARLSNTNFRRSDQLFEQARLRARNP